MIMTNILNERIKNLKQKYINILNNVDYLPKNDKLWENLKWHSTEEF